MPCFPAIRSRMSSLSPSALTCPTYVAPRAYFVTIYHMSDEYGVAYTEQCHSVLLSESFLRIAIGRLCQLWPAQLRQPPQIGKPIRLLPLCGNLRRVGKRSSRPPSTQRSAPCTPPSASSHASFRFPLPCSQRFRPAGRPLEGSCPAPGAQARCPLRRLAGCSRRAQGQGAGSDRRLPRPAREADVFLLQGLALQEQPCPCGPRLVC